MDSSTFLYDAPPAVVERFCKIVDSGGDGFGWRALAVRIVPTLLEVQMLERVEAAGRSPTREMLWSWAQQNKTVRDLLTVLQDMGHRRALQLFQGQPITHLQTITGMLEGNYTQQQRKYATVTPGNQHTAPTRQTSSDDKVKVSLQGKGSSSSQALGPQKLTLTFQDVIEGTRDFHREMRISEGQFSDVYRGQTGNKTFVVKLFKQNSVASWRTLWDIFRKEVEIHHLYQHPNILELLGCFSDERHYCLVHPFVPGGSLFRRLHHRVIPAIRRIEVKQEAAEVPQHLLQALLSQIIYRSQNQEKAIKICDRKPPLSWQERLNIVKGVAKALHHLHTTQPCPVICGNLSSANVLLDEDQPKLTDFGLARLRPHSTSQNCTITLNTGYHSNLGYLPEEYIRDGKLSFSLDVYSFGMVIMETVTGRKVIEDAPKQTQLRDVLIAEAEDSGGVDSCLQFLDEAAGRWPTALALRLLALALECAASRHRSRPSMADVLPALSQLLPPPVVPLADQPHSLDDGAPLTDHPVPSSTKPVEEDDDVRHSLPAGPCECSQSEVTYLSDIPGADGKGVVDLYCSWPVQCSCPAETGGLPCEDCRANGFTPNHTDGRQDLSVVENEAKQRVRNKLSLYNKGLIHTEELLSETGLQ